MLIKMKFLFIPSENLFHDEIVNRRLQPQLSGLFDFHWRRTSWYETILKATLCLNKVGCECMRCLMGKEEQRNFLIKLYYVEWRRRSWKMISIEHGGFFSLLFCLPCRHKSPEWNKRRMSDENGFFLQDDEHIKQIWMINNKNTILICLNIYDAMNTTTKESSRCLTEVSARDSI